MISCGATGAGVSVAYGAGKFRLGERGNRPDGGRRNDERYYGENDHLAHLVSPFSAWQADDGFGTRSAVPRVKGLTQADFLSSREPRRACGGTV